MLGRGCVLFFSSLKTWHGRGRDDDCIYVIPNVASMIMMNSFETGGAEKKGRLGLF